MQGLLIVDVQNGFINPHSSAVVAGIEQLQYDYQQVFVTRFFNPGQSMHRRLIGMQGMAYGSNGFALAFAAREDAVLIDKCTYSAVDKLLLAHLQATGISQMDICGIDTDICVTQNAVGLFESDIIPRVLARHCASHAGIAYHQQALTTLKRLIGAEQVID